MYLKIFLLLFFSIKLFAGLGVVDPKQKVEYEINKKGEIHFKNVSKMEVYKYCVNGVKNKKLNLFEERLDFLKNDYNEEEENYYEPERASYDSEFHRVLQSEGKDVGIAFRKLMKILVPNDKPPSSSAFRLYTNKLVARLLSNAKDKEQSEDIKKASNDYFSSHSLLMDHLNDVHAVSYTKDTDIIDRIIKEYGGVFKNGNKGIGYYDTNDSSDFKSGILSLSIDKIGRTIYDLKRDLEYGIKPNFEYKKSRLRLLEDIVKLNMAYKRLGYEMHTDKNNKILNGVIKDTENLLNTILNPKESGKDLICKTVDKNETEGGLALWACTQEKGKTGSIAKFLKDVSKVGNAWIQQERKKKQKVDSHLWQYLGRGGTKGSNCELHGGYKIIHSAGEFRVETLDNSSVKNKLFDKSYKLSPEMIIEALDLNLGDK